MGDEQGPRWSLKLELTVEGGETYSQEFVVPNDLMTLASSWNDGRQNVFSDKISGEVVGLLRRATGDAR